jgi:hypothetical protein
MRHTIFAIALFAQCYLVHAQGTGSPSPQPATPERNSISLVGAGTLANGYLKGTSSDRHLTFFGISYNRLLFQKRDFGLTLTSMAIPVAFLREPFFIGTDIQAAQSQAQPFVGFQGGFLYFNRNVLASQAAQFNFTLDGRTGVRIPLQQEKAISVSYMFQHMSNSYTAIDNPGVDCHMVMVAYTFPIHFGHSH